jgi:hypothetical protein
MYTYFEKWEASSRTFVVKLEVIPEDSFAAEQESSNAPL